MPDVFIVRSRRGGWDIYRLPDGSLRRTTIAKDCKSYDEVQRVMNDAANHIAGRDAWAMPERRKPRTEFFSLRTLPEYIP